MSKLTDAELSLAVAFIMWPEYSDTIAIIHRDGDSQVWLTPYGGQFNHTTDDALGKMCIWLANKKKDSLITGIPMMYDLLIAENPHRAIAEAIVEAGND